MGLFIAISVCIIILTLGLVVVSQSVRHVYIRFFILMCLCIIVWVVSNYLTDNFSNNVEKINVSNKIAFLSAYAVVFFGLLFTYFFPVRRSVKFPEMLVLALLAISASITSLLDWVVGSPVLKDGTIMFTSGDGVGLYVVCFLAIVALIYRNLTNRKRYNLQQRSQARIVLIAFMLSAAIGLLLNVIIPAVSNQWHTTELGPLVVVFLVGLISYAIIKHGLFDIKTAAVRSAVYTLSIITLAAIYYLVAYFISITLFQGEVSSTVSINPVNIALALVLAFVFQPIKNFFDKVTDKIFFRDRYSSDEFYSRLSEVLTTTTDLHNLLQRASREIGETLKAEQAFFFVQYNHHHHVSGGTSYHSILPLADAHYLNDYVKVNGDGLIVAEVLPENDSVRRLLVSHKIALLMPLMRRDIVLGYLSLGEQRGSGYTKRDTKVLTTIADELVIGIQNALSVQEVKDINVHLQQRIDAATQQLRSSNTQLRHLDTTKDEFLSMASHQLRTPLTSVKGYLSMVLEGDAGKVTDMQKHLLGEAFISSERMVHLIHDFLNVSRLQTGKFMLEQHPFDLAKLVREEVDSLRHTAEARKLKLKFIDTTELPLLNIDENKIRQVVMNFIDNSLFYSHQDTTITIELNQKNDEVELLVRDNGIGVPKNEQEQLFSKFYRASNARKQRPDGTGVGLFLAKKVIDGHGGRVLFTSKEDEGSTFGFSLPMQLLAVSQPDDANNRENDHKDNQNKHP